MQKEEAEQWADQELERYSARPQTTMQLYVERIDNPIDPLIIDDGKVTRVIPRNATLILSVDGQEVERKIVGPYDTYHIAISSNGKASLMVCAA